jgi:hypothetical protein
VKKKGDGSQQDKTRIGLPSVLVDYDFELAHFFLVSFFEAIFKFSVLYFLVSFCLYLSYEKCCVGHHHLLYIPIFFHTGGFQTSE